MSNTDMKGRDECDGKIAGAGAREGDGIGAPGRRAGALQEAFLSCARDEAPAADMLGQTALRKDANWITARYGAVLTGGTPVGVTVHGCQSTEHALLVLEFLEQAAALDGEDMEHRSRHIVNTFGAKDTDHTRSATPTRLSFAVMEAHEWMDVGALRDVVHLSTDRRVPEKACAAIAFQVLRAIADSGRLPKYDEVYISANTILFRCDGRVKLKRRIDAPMNLDNLNNMNMRHVHLDAEMVAPEETEGWRTKATCMWRLGVAILYMLGHHTLGAGKTLGQILLATQGKVPTIPRDVAPALQLLLEKCLRKEPNKRISAAMALQSAWFRNHGITNSSQAEAVTERWLNKELRHHCKAIAKHTVGAPVRTAAHVWRTAVGPAAHTVAAADSRPGNAGAAVSGETTALNPDHAPLLTRKHDTTTHDATVGLDLCTLGARVATTGDAEPVMVTPRKGRILPCLAVNLGGYYSLGYTTCTWRAPATSRKRPRSGTHTPALAGAGVGTTPPAGVADTAEATAHDVDSDLRHYIGEGGVTGAGIESGAPREKQSLSSPVMRPPTPWELVRSHDISPGALGGNLRGSAFLRPPSVQPVDAVTPKEQGGRDGAGAHVPRIMMRLPGLFASTLRAVRKMGSKATPVAAAGVSEPGTPTKKGKFHHTSAPSPTGDSAPLHSTHKRTEGGVSATKSNSGARTRKPRRRNRHRVVVTSTDLSTAKPGVDPVSQHAGPPSTLPGVVPSAAPDLVPAEAPPIKGLLGEDADTPVERIDSEPSNRLGHADKPATLKTHGPDPAEKVPPRAPSRRLNVLHVGRTLSPLAQCASARHLPALTEAQKIRIAKGPPLRACPQPTPERTPQRVTTPTPTQAPPCAPSRDVRMKSAPERTVARGGRGPLAATTLQSKHAWLDACPPERRGPLPPVTRGNGPNTPLGTQGSRRAMHDMMGHPGGVAAGRAGMKPRLGSARRRVKSEGDALKCAIAAIDTCAPEHKAADAAPMTNDELVADRVARSDMLQMPQQQQQPQRQPQKESKQRAVVGGARHHKRGARHRAHQLSVRDPSARPVPKNRRRGYGNFVVLGACTGDSQPTRQDALPVHQQSVTQSVVPPVPLAQKTITWDELPVVEPRATTPPSPYVHAVAAVTRTRPRSAPDLLAAAAAEAGVVLQHTDVPMVWGASRRGFHFETPRLADAESTGVTDSARGRIDTAVQLSRMDDHTAQ